MSLGWTIGSAESWGATLWHGSGARAMARGRPLDVESELLEAFRHSGSVSEHLVNVLPDALWRVPAPRPRPIDCGHRRPHAERATYVRQDGWCAPWTALPRSQPGHSLGGAAGAAPIDRRPRRPVRRGDRCPTGPREGHAAPGRGHARVSDAARRASQGADRGPGLGPRPRVRRRGHDAALGLARAAAEPPRHPPRWPSLKTRARAPCRSGPKPFV